MKKNNFISLFLCMLLAVSIIPKTVHADTEQGPIEIEATEQDVTETHGDITTDEDDALSIYAANGYTANITAGDLTSTDDDGLYVYVDGDDSNVIAEVGNIVSYDDAVIVNVDTNDEEDTSSAVVTTGDIESGYYGISVSTGNGSGEIEITTGDIMSEDQGIYAGNYGNNLYITTGSIDSEDTGIEFHGENDSRSIVEVNGDINSADDGIWAEVYDEEIPYAWFNVKGDINAGEDGIDFGAYDNAATVAFVAGDVTATETGLNLYADGNAFAETLVQGDVVAGDQGAALYGDSEGYTSFYANSVSGGNVGIVVSNWEESEANAVVLETVEGGVVAVAVDSADSENREGASIVAWSIELNERGNVAELYDSSDDFVLLEEADEDFEKNNIFYFIKMLQPENGLIEVTDEDGGELDEVYVLSFDEEQDGEFLPVAQQDQKVLVKVTPTEGYKIDAVYNGKGDRVELLTDDDGNYYVLVPKGGAVYLTADLVLDDYAIIKQTGDPHEIGGGQDLSIEINASVDEFESVWVDDSNVTKHAVVTEGSTIVTLPSSLLDTLAVGAHNLLVRFLGDHDVLSTFNVIEGKGGSSSSDDDHPHRIPVTGVDAMTAANHNYKAYMVGAFATVCAIAVLKKRNLHK